MHILHWIDSFLPLIGGAEVMLDHLTTRQHTQGHAVMVVTNRHTPEHPAVETRRGVEVRRLALLAPLHQNDLAALGASVRAVKALLHQYRPDVVHLHLCNVTGLIYLMAVATPAPRLVVTLHTPPEHLHIPTGIVRRILDAASAIAAVSHAGAAAWRAAYPSSMDRLTVVYNALPTPDCTPAPPPDPPVLLALGRLQPVKGFDVAIRAVRHLHDQGRACRLVIAGDGPARPELETLVADLGLRDAVTFTGMLAPATVPAQINQATLLVMPSRWQEPFGLVALQAGQMARPLVASAVGGLTEVVVDGETGLLVPPDDVAALAQALARLLDAPALAAQLGQQARRHVQARFGLDACLAAYAQLYTAGGPAPNDHHGERR